MIAYLEIREIIPPGDATQPQELRVQVADKADALDRLPGFLNLFTRDYELIKQVHYCRHDEGGKCSVEPL